MQADSSYMGRPVKKTYKTRTARIKAENDIPFHAIRIDSRQEAQNAPTPITNYALFHDGTYITNEQMNEKKFLKLIDRLEG